jgi:hypothetical protein
MRLEFEKKFRGLYPNLVKQKIKQNEEGWDWLGKGKEGTGDGREEKEGSKERAI